MGAEAESAAPAARSGKLPRHVAIIMDGNGRWAQQHGLPRSEGHRRGVEALRRAVRFAVRNGIHFLTLFSFSSENWSRPQDEIRDLFDLLRDFIRSDLAEMKAEKVRIRVIGDRQNLPSDIRGLIEIAENETATNAGLQLMVAFNYGARDEILRAARTLTRRVLAGDLTVDDIDAARFEGALDTAGVPDPDLILRTSGEKRISNFLLWQGAYSEFIFFDDYWPDFGDEHFAAALREFSARERRYGGIGAA